MGIDAVVPHHVTTVFTFWQHSSMNMLPGISKFSTTHDLLWVETMLSCVVSFLKFSPELLLAVPDALTRLTGLLEKVFPLISSGGRFEREANYPVGSARLSSARSSVMEGELFLSDIECLVFGEISKPLSPICTVMKPILGYHRDHFPCLLIGYFPLLRHKSR